MKTCFLLFLSAAFLLVLIGTRAEVLAVAAPVFTNHRDIGVTPLEGATHVDWINRTYTITGGGANIWSRADAFQFAYTQVSRDVMVTASVQFVGRGREAHRKAAVMIRQNLDPDSAYADVAVHGDGLTSLQYRRSAGAETEELRSDEKSPAFIRIMRRGNQFTMLTGSTPEDLKPTGPVTVDMTDPVYVGLAVCSHNAKVLETAIFKNIALQLGDQ